VKKILLYLCLICFACKKPLPQNFLKEGDILFQNLNCGALCEAIETVTTGVDGKDFSHCSMVINDNDTLKVIEAIGNEVQINSVHNFFLRSGDTSTIKNITIGRVKNEYASILPKAIAFVKKQVGTPYDDEFVLNNEKLYCSELLYDAFKESNGNKDFFTLQPMTFKDPATKQFFPAWVSYYQNLKKPIPEGKLGLNPGLMSSNKNIDIVEIKYFKNITPQ
jgi:hypothetical protein